MTKEQEELFSKFKFKIGDKVIMRCLAPNTDKGIVMVQLLCASVSGECYKAYQIHFAKGIRQLFEQEIEESN